MRGVLLLSVVFLAGQVLCGVDREFEKTNDVEEFQIPSDGSAAGDDVDDDILEDSVTDDDTAVTWRAFNKVLTVKNGGPWGTWGKISFCPGETFAVGYEMKIEPKVLVDNTALNAIKLLCADEKGNIKGEVTSTQGKWGKWVGAMKCRGDRYLSAFDLQVEKPRGACIDDTAANYVKFNCRCQCGRHSTPLVKPPGHGRWGTWGAWSANCPRNSGICGIQTKVEKPQKFGDDTALNDVKFYCCKFP